MIEVLRKAVEDSSLVNKTLTGGSGKEQKSYQVKSTDDFSYTDPIDGSLTSKQVVNLCALFGCNNDHLFSEKYTVKDYISNTKLEKGDHYYIRTLHKDLFSHYNVILRKL